MPVPGAAIRAMPGDLGWLPARLPGTGPAVLAGELVGRVRAELPAVGEPGEPEQVLVSAWLTGLRSALTCVPAPTGMLPRVELPEVILEVMSWGTTARGIVHRRLRRPVPPGGPADLGRRVPVCSVVAQGPPQTGSLISPSLALLGAGGVPYAAKERALVGGASTHET
jgi:hypothetical protein